MNRQNKAKTPKKAAPPTKPKPSLSKDPVEVFCRLRPNANVADLTCVRRYNDTTIQLVSPSSPRIELFYSFRYVFPETATQKELFDCVALPLVSDLLAGKNGLLFTYGITSSGKTFTVTGNPQNNGILPRCLDVIFNSIGDNQSRKYAFKPDGQNGFKIQSTPDAMLDLQKEKQYPRAAVATPARTPKIKRKENDENKEWEQREKETTSIELPNFDHAYAVFISYVEIYNNYIYDLLDDTMSDQLKLRQIQQPQSKMLREDSRKRVYVSGGTEIEVKNSVEAFDVFMKGVRRRRIAHTALNAESSRSHSVFNIRIVQAPRDSVKEVITDERFMIVSQLSLVDLAGSERTGRTQNTGERLREAGSINNSLMTLRSCIDVLRENQRANSNKIVPYRDNKLTHLFKNFFEGEGKIRMIICVNSGADDFDETMHVMKFAEATQEVMVTRATDPLKMIFESKERFETFDLRIPSSLLDDPDDDKVFPEWIEYFEERKKNSEIKFLTLHEQEQRFRSQLADMEAENMFLNKQVSVLKADLEVRENQLKTLESKCSHAERMSDNKAKRIEELEKKHKDLQREIDEMNRQLDAFEAEKREMKIRMREQLDHERERLKRIFERLLSEKQAELERQQCLTKEKMHLVKEILNSDNTDWEFLREYRESLYPNLPTENAATASVCPTPEARTQSTISAATVKRKSVADFAQSIATPPVHGEASAEPTSPKISSAPPVVNPRHRRSLSTGTEKWIDHRPPGTLDLGTVLRPKIKNKRSVTNLKELGTNDLKQCSKYALTHHEAVDNGEVETYVFKGEVIPSVGGGSQVIFQDVESLKQNSPPGR
ncbi:kinesin-like protein KIF23 [Dinothrombium tinctorium]|uniref:Kinesin-like protein n=1 Tax=Dinothrombium tinctorium TaxID=1965070 RepID=A0A443RCZ4_9ACAR|nr:kinesin-like protein KIF23 [Dinothrombium tinctorium]RWS13161.1 kinesin-like protein KIF23 [Dinothrombium tinctorium]RWS13609.1 kinesin-like protein KIF23 [Dinothrombium tinctorium]